MKTAVRPRRASTSQRFVIPVRYEARGEVMQTTSTTLTARAIHLRSVEPPNPGLILGLKLYFPASREVVVRSGTVLGITQDSTPGFWAQFSDDANGSTRIAQLLAEHREMGDRGCTRVATHLPVAIRQTGLPGRRGVISNLSRSGAFLELGPVPPVGTVVELELALADGQPDPKALALVVHAAAGRGAGVQFVGGTDAFRTRLDQHLASLAG